MPSCSRGGFIAKSTRRSKRVSRTPRIKSVKSQRARGKGTRKRYNKKGSK